VGALATNLIAKDSQVENAGPGPWMTLDGNSRPHIVFSDYKHGLKASVAAYNGESWELVGKPGFSDQWTQDGVIAIDESSGARYVALTALSGKLPYYGGVSVWTLQNDRWTSLGLVGNASFSRPSLAVIGGAPHVLTSWSSGDLSKPRPYAVMRFDDTSKSWETVGGAPFAVSLVDEMVMAASARSDGQETYVAFSKSGWLYPKEAHNITIMGLVKGSWLPIGGKDFVSGSGLSLAVDPVNGFPVIAFQDMDNNKLTVMAYNGATWIALGGRGGASDAEIDDWASPPSLSVSPSGKIAVAYHNVQPSVGGRVVTWDNGSWMPLGPYVSADHAWTTMCLKFDKDDKPFLGYTKTGSSTGAGHDLSKVVTTPVVVAQLV